MKETKDQIIQVDQEITIDKMIDDTITGKMIGEIISGMMIGETITDKIIEGTTIEVTTGKTMNVIIMETRGIEIEVQVVVYKVLLI